MARPRNEELYQRIKKTAYLQLVRKGYEETTYQSIATECGVTRTAVQNYFSSKAELALSFFGDLLAAVKVAVQITGMHQENEFDAMFCIGQSFFELLLQDEGGRRLLLDTSASREITSQVLNFEMDWGREFIASERTVSEEKWTNDIIVSMGGFYELLYQKLLAGEEIDIGTHLGRVVRSIMHDHGWAYDDAKAFVAAHILSGDELQTIHRLVRDSMGLEA